MAGRTCWRLLAVVSLIFASPAHLRGQAVPADRLPELSDTPRYPRPSFLTRLPVESTVPPQPPSLKPGTAALHKISGAAGIIFSGHVTAINRTSLNPGPFAASTSVTFQVEQGIRGVSTGQALTIHEWSGLWNSGERYRVGERVFLFLYPPSKLGLTSPVAGAMGRFAMDAGGRILMNGQYIGSLIGNPAVGSKSTVSFAEFVRAAGLASPRE